MHKVNDSLRFNRARFLSLASLMLLETLRMRYAEANDGSRVEEASDGDFAINATTALLFSDEAPLKPLIGKRDSKAVWARVFPGADSRAVLVYLHGNNNYVTVDTSGVSRVPDWAADDPIAVAGASAKKAAPLIYGLDRIDPKEIGKAPVLLVPEDATHRTGAFWASEPAGQFADSDKLGRLIDDCMTRLTRLRSAYGNTLGAIASSEKLSRLYLCGHSGAGLPLQEAAASEIALPHRGTPTDLWLFDCTYWSNVANFAHFCDQWQQVGRLAGSKADASRFVCVYRPKTQTEEIANTLRGQIAKILGVSADTLVMDHSGDNYTSDIRPALRQSGVVFIRTSLPHDEIPTFFIPRLLETAAS